MESALLGEEQIIAQFEQSCEQRKPVFTPAVKPMDPSYLYGEIVQPERMSVDDGMAFVGGIVCFLCAPLCFSYPNGLLNFISVALLPLGIGCFKISGTFERYQKRKKIEKHKREIDSLVEEYKAKCIELDKRNQRMMAECEAQTAQWLASSAEGKALLTKKKTELAQTLETYYGADVIYPKYRSLPALTSIYEYLITGRCETLAGADGAYNLYEMELRQNTVIAQLNTIISNLEQIRQNQYMLYQELTKLNATIGQIANDIAAIRGYSITLTGLASLNAYYSAVTAQSTSALAFMYALG